MRCFCRVDSAVSVAGGDRTGTEIVTPLAATLSPMTASALLNASLTTLEFVRRTAGMSRPELAERSGVSVATILASERSGRVPHLATARRLVAALSLAVDDLFPEGERAHV